MNNSETQRKLSPWRVLFAIFALAALVSGGLLASTLWQREKVSTSSKAWFAPYVDVTATPAFAFEQVESNPSREVMLSFIVSSASKPCEPSWGGAYSIDEAASSLDLDRRIERLRQQKGNIAISFGGLSNQELAVACKNDDQLYKAYKSIIQRYDINTVDLDLEGESLTDSASAERRAKVISKLQSDMRSDGKNLAVWATLPVATFGLTEDGTNAVSVLLKNKVDLAGVNGMTMNYGDSLKSGQTMFEGSKEALENLHRQLGILYEQNGTHLNNATLWSKIGVTPLIGQNDVHSEVFTLDDAKKINEFAISKGVGRMSMWSANRDLECGINYIDIKKMSDACSGVLQEKHAFSSELRKKFDGSILSSSSSVTKSDPQSSSSDEADDPKSSPYQIWSPDGAYLQGTKVVWHKNVYEAKWWTQNDTPDNPVLQSWETPWKLIGPVLPGDKPVARVTLPAGTYPEWSGTTIYETGSRVLFEGVPYQAKWWNTANSPAAALSNADNSPWAPLTKDQIKDIKKQ